MENFNNQTGTVIQSYLRGYKTVSGQMRIGTGRKGVRCPSSRKVRKVVSQSYKKRYGTYYEKFPLNRVTREKVRASELAVTRGKIWSWKDPDNIIMSYIDQSSWFESVLKSTGNKSCENFLITGQVLENRRKFGRILAHMNFIRIKEALYRDKMLLSKDLTQHEHKNKFTAIPEKNIVFVILDMTTKSDVVSTKKREGVYKEISDRSGFVYIEVCGQDVSICIPVIIVPFSSLLDVPEISWKSFSGTRKSTERIFADRDGIHSSALQLLDRNIDKCKDGVIKRMIVVHDDSIAFAGDSDVVHCLSGDLNCILVRMLERHGLIIGEI